MDQDFGFGFVAAKDMTNEQRIKDERARQHWHAIREQITRRINKHASKLVKVDNIICFALGALSHKQPKSCIEHLVASTVRDEIQTLRDQSSEYADGPRIEIVAQDPAYCETCASVLKTSWT